MVAMSFSTTLFLLTMVAFTCSSATYTSSFWQSPRRYDNRYYQQGVAPTYYNPQSPSSRSYQYQPDSPSRSHYSQPRQRTGISSSSQQCWITTPTKCDGNSPYRTIDGSCNNLKNPTWGQSVRQIGRRLSPQYNPGSKTDIRTIGVTGRPLPSARKVSTAIHRIATKNDLSTKLSTMHMTWGQFIDHDMTHVPLTRPMTCCNQTGGRQHPDCIAISIPHDDEHFSSTGRTCMELRRSIAIKPGQCGNEFREQLNNLTSYIDAGSVYGSTTARANQLRAFTRGEMVESERQSLLPTDKPGTACDIPPPQPDKRCFAAGDTRSNEWGGLTALHTAFVREHNRIARIFYRQFKRARPYMTEKNLDERIYQEARKIIGAFLQVINYGEYLPNVLGVTQMRKWRLNLQHKAPYSPKHTYNPQLNPTSTNVFGTAAFRFGHSEVAFGVQPKSSSYHNSSKFATFTELFNQPTSFRQVGNDNLIRGMLLEPTLKTSKFSPEIRDRLFERSFSGLSLDLPAVSTQRGREHGLPTYNAWRRYCGLPTVTFDYMPDHPVELQRSFASVYDHPDDIDLFPAGITERHVAQDAQVGPTFACIIGQEFQRLKEGDRFWFENQGTYTNSFTDDKIRQLSQITLSRVLCDTTPGTDWIPENAFRIDSNFVRCQDIPRLNLNNWLGLGLY
ncbi:myeloperoxidase-like [Watersipora subatra]|uniref:myeloperoxidase-like n=1 Tax=Watersipora subatra TaxID=2589382 RepID=UPI00355BBC10